MTRAPRTGRFIKFVGLLHGSVGAIRLFVDLAVLVVGVFATIHLSPDPVFLWRATPPSPAGGEFIAEYVFTNPNSNWPIQGVTARWGVEDETVRLAVQAPTIGFKTQNPAPLVRELLLLQDVPAHTAVNTWLKSEHSFVVSGPIIRAFVPEITGEGVGRKAVTILNSGEWEHRKTLNGMKVAAIFVLLGLFILALHASQVALGGFLQRTGRTSV